RCDVVGVWWRWGVGVDVIDGLRPHSGIRQGVAHTGDDRLAIRARAGAVKRVGFLAAALENTQHVGAAGDGMIVILKHECRPAFGEYKSIAVLGERLGGLLRRVVLGGGGRKGGES